jgi:isopentenyl diphosphate isomerase/L-lactate dehydrogenase-like FMN-dependent dehydrogenase
VSRIGYTEPYMTRPDDKFRTTHASRRAFCRFLAASPLWAAAGVAVSEQALAAQIGEDELGAFTVPEGALIESAEDAVNVFDLEAVARNKLPPAHYGQIATGAGSGRTVMRNRAAFNAWGIQARRMVGVSKIDTSLELLGTKLAYPIMLSPIGSHKIADPLGEVSTARGAAAANANMLLSTFSSTGIEDVIKARGGPVWYQLYPSSEWRVSEALVKRAEKAGAPVIVATVDGVGGSRREVFERFKRVDKRDCTACHSPNDDRFGTAPMFAGLDMKGVGLLGNAIDWSFIRKLRQTTTRKLVIKGILAGEDAALAVEAGADAVIVSNHGGRAFDTGVGTLEVLPEIVAAVGGRIPVIIDSGFRRGTDVFKALALGAKAVCMGRPYMWGLAAFGEKGVAAALKLVSAEFAGTMRTAGTLTLAQIDAKRIRRL